MVWNEKSEEALVPSLFSGRQAAEAILKFKACAGKVPVVGDAKMLAEERRTGESKSSAGLRPAGMAKQEEGDMGGREIGSEGGGADLNLGTPPPPVPAKSLLNDRPPPPPPSSPPPPARRSEKEA